MVKCELQIREVVWVRLYAINIRQWNAIIRIAVTIKGVLIRIFGAHHQLMEPGLFLITNAWNSPNTWNIWSL